jgi:hypothetical protein
MPGTSLHSGARKRGPGWPGMTATLHQPALLYGRADEG